MNKNLWALLEDNETDRMLVVVIVQRHVKLVAEYNHRTTCLERREAIQAEIALLREEFKQIIERGENNERNTHIQPHENIGNLDSIVPTHTTNNQTQTKRKEALLSKASWV
ncbi:hypothetical protein [Paenibacillus eucommiae]|uniref:Uncharacterized protein n=1 Tax=Paenibacillus eucommiae TaxID=1355755 RepID=A0ABS4IQN4_9BACL|nr:hypothetical protein [Paenibacillus eucommiae]MBP1989201.1 hypothetical protein [Paenibacillus eucommiae]